MTRKLFLVAAAALALAACTTAQVQSFAQIQEKADTEASLLYAAIASSVNAFETLPSTTADQKATAEALKVKAWNDLQIERAAYAAGQAVDLSILTADQQTAAKTTSTQAPTPAATLDGDAAKALADFLGPQT